MSVRELSVSYGGVTAVEHVTFDVHEGTLVGVIGPNGAGKTSLVDGLTGYVKSTGVLRLAGQDLSRFKPRHRVRAGLARTWQSVQLFDDLTVHENVQVAAEATGGMRKSRDHAKTIAWALDATGLHDLSQSYPRELSHGQRKLAGVARALATRPRVIALDEPAAGLDTAETLEFGKHLRSLPEQGTTVMLIDHDMNLIMKFCDDILVLDFGRLIAQGPPEEVRNDPSVLAAYLGRPHEEEEDPARD